MSNLKPGAVLYAKDIELVRAFYQDVVGLEVVDAKKDHFVLESSTFQLVIVQTPNAIASSIELERPAKRRVETPIKLVFPVGSIASVRAAAILSGGQFNPPDREWKFRSSRVCDGQDPEGNVVQVRENAL